MALTQVKTLGIADDAVTEAKVANDAISPTEMKAGTDGHIITYDASGNPTTVGPGTDGQVLTSTGAGSPPAFETLPTSGAALTGSTNNTVVTVTGANAMAGEATLTYDGANLQQKQTGNTATQIILDSNRSAADNEIGGIVGKWDTETVADMRFFTDDDTSNKDNGYISFRTSTASGSLDETLRLKPNRDVQITDGNLIIGTAGHGIDFSATGDSSGTMSNELLDDYEEGTWDPVLYSTGGGDDFGYSSRAGYYQKVGGVVHYYCNIQWTKGGGVSAGYVYCKGFPFTTRNNPGSYYYIGSNMNLGGLDANRPFNNINANGNNTIAAYNTGGSTGLTGFAETGDIASSGSSWFSITVFTDA